MFDSPDTIGSAGYKHSLIQLVNKATGMSSSQFTLSYDGNALKNGQMDVRELAPALMAVGELLSEANRQVNRDRVTLSVSVQAGFEKGSFDVILVTTQSVLSQLSALVTGEHIVDASAIVILLFGGRGLLDLLKWLGGALPEKSERLPNGDVNITLKDRSITINGNVYNFYGDPTMRKAVRPVIKPLEKDGIDVFRAVSDNKLLLEVQKKDAHSLTDIDMQEKVISDSEGEAYLQIVSLSFKEDNKWRLWDGTSSSLYSIEDQGFLTSIDQHSETFGKDDTLKCKIRSIVRLSRDGELKKELSVTKVIEHMGAPTQARLFPQG